MRQIFNSCAVVVGLMLLAGKTAAETTPLGPLPPNLAKQAQISASSEHAGSLLATMVADGRITRAGGQMAEFGSWATVGEKEKGKGEIS